MYWCKPPVLPWLAAGLALAASLAACKPDIKETAATSQYFNLKGFFKADSARLTQRHPLVTKTVMHNDEQETKQVTIGNWGQELSPFSQSDINKPAWRHSYRSQVTTGFTVYTALDPKLITRRIAISRDSATQKVKWILINNSTHNLLYTSAEKLTYYPDSLYQIEKKQTIRLIGTNRYLIKGVIKR